MVTSDVKIPEIDWRVTFLTSILHLKKLIQIAACLLFNVTVLTFNSRRGSPRKFRYGEEAAALPSLFQGSEEPFPRRQQFRPATEAIYGSSCKCLPIIPWRPVFNQGTARAARVATVPPTGLTLAAASGRQSGLEAEQL